jgi:hypothetical protein
MKAPLDPTPYARDPRSQPLSAATQDGSYVYVRDEAGTVLVVPDGPHMHPKVLGDARSAMYAGDLTVQGRTVTDLTNLSGRSSSTMKKDSWPSPIKFGCNG